MLGNLNNYNEEKAYLSDVNNWHITLGESDWYMLNI